MKSVPYTPVSHPFIERLIGTVRREFLDRVFFWNGMDLTRKPRELGTITTTPIAFIAHWLHTGLAEALSWSL
jgi:hypothetical protein